MAAFPARFAGTCSRCGKHFPAGTRIQWSRKRRGQAYHENCYSIPNENPIPAPDTFEVPQNPDDDNNSEAYNILRDTYNPTPNTEDNDVPADSNSILNIDALVAALQGKLEAKMPKAPEIDLEAIRIMVAAEVAKLATLTVKVEQQDLPTVTVENAHKQFAAALKVVSRGRHLYLYGPAGSGKSTIAQMLSEALGLDYGYISLNPQTPDSRLQGFLDANGVYRDPVFRRCYEKGGVFCIDECDNASGALLTTLNGCIENGHAAFPDGPVKKHPKFILVATGNTAGRGANPAYPERRPFDAAFGDRFVYLPVGYDEALERKIALGFNPDASFWVDWIQAIREWALSNLPRLLVSPRASIVGADLLAAGFSVKEVSDMVLFKGFDADGIKKLLAANPLPKVA